MRIAITRAVSPAIDQCELTHLARQSIDVANAQVQHQRYERCLAELGCQVVSLPAEPTLPDSVFVEDGAVVVDEVAIITRPGAASRRPETISLAAALAPYRQLVHIEAPGKVDGGDVLRIDRDIFVGLSTRSNKAAVEQMKATVEPYGYAVTAVEVAGCLHLKSAVTQVAEGAVLLNPMWIDAALFGHMTVLEVAPEEPHAANALLVGNTVVLPGQYPKTLRRLQKAGLTVRSVDVSELIKAEGAVTCCSLIFNSK